MRFKGIEICCPQCHGDLHRLNSDTFQCFACQKQYPIILDIPDLRVFPDPYIDPEADWAKGRNVAAHLHDMTFEALVAYYYSVTSVVPPHHAQQYTRGLMAGVARAEGSLAAWEKDIQTNGHTDQGCLLEIGCGTAPMLVAAASQFQQSVGVDIAFRWLVVAKKRLAEAGLDIPLICACAEALPFPQTQFDRIIADSVIEHLKDQPQAIAECTRVMQPGSHLCLVTPNRYSLGPDPHTGVWAGGYLPERWMAAYVRRQGGIPPKRRLLDGKSLRHLLTGAGLTITQIKLPDIPPGQRHHFGSGINRLIDIYHLTKQLPLSKQLLYRIGPMLQVIAKKPASEVQPPVSSQPETISLP